MNITIVLAFLSRSELKSVQIIDFYVSLLFPSISGQEINFFLFQSHHWINDCHMKPGYRELLKYTAMCSSWKMSRIIFLKEYDYSGISNRLFFFWERIVKFVLMTVVKWDSEILMPFPSIMPSLCCHRHCFNL